MVGKKGFMAGVVWCILFCGPVARSLEGESLFSENTAAHFIKHATEVHRQDPLDMMRTAQAMLFLEGADLLDTVPDQIPEKILWICASSSGEGPDYSDNLAWALDRYLKSPVNLDMAFDALRCMLDHLNSRTDREVLLEKLYRRHASTNPVFASEVATQLGLLAIEKADMKAALSYFTNAHALNPYNQLAFSKVVELGADNGVSATPSAQIRQMRAALEVDPYDPDAAVRYADALRRLEMYDIASDTYAYAADVYQFRAPDQPLPDQLVHDWLFSCYRDDRLAAKCPGIVEAHREPTRFNLVFEAVAGKALIKMGQAEKGKRHLLSAAQKAKTLVLEKGRTKLIYPEDLAWFYSFVSEEPDEALAWSNQAFLEDPNRVGVQSMFAYCLALNGQGELAQKYVASADPTDQIASLTKAMTLLSQDQKQSALDALRATVQIRPESFVAEKAMRLLKEQGSDYIPSVSSNTVRTFLEGQYGNRVVPTFEPPANRCSVKLLFNGSDFLYEADFLPRLVIENTSDDAMVICDDGFLKGVLRVDATLQGSINVQIPNVLSMRFRPPEPILPGRHISVPLELNQGRLRRVLMTYPQADVQIRFTLYVDPVISTSGEFEHQTQYIPPVQTEIRRRGVVLSQNFLMQRLDVLAKGQPGQKYQAASLFTGLLAEQKAIDLSGAEFERVQVEPALLTDSVRKLLTDKDWKIRAHTLSCLLSLSIPLESGILREVSGDLNHEKWPVRLLAMCLLAKAQPETFQKVLDWATENDSYDLNRRMAIALGGHIPKPEPSETPPEASN